MRPRRRCSRPCRRRGTNQLAHSKQSGHFRAQFQTRPPLMDIIRENETTRGPRTTMPRLPSALPLLPRSPPAADARRLGALACRRLCSASAATAAAVEEARSGRKQLGMTPQLYDYLLANVREHPVRPLALPSPLLHFRFEPSAAVLC
jgi:hypothetical protein